MSMLLRLFGFVLLLIVAVAALAPATLLAPPIARESGGVLTLVEAAGTVWSGRGTLFAAGERIPVAWKVEPAAILGGELAVRLTGQDAARPLPRALISASLDRLAATNVEIALPAAALLAAAGTCACGPRRSSVEAPSLRAARISPGTARASASRDRRSRSTSAALR